MLREAGLRVVAHRSSDPNVNLGVNNRADLALAAAEARRQILERHMLAGVTIVDPGSTWIDAEVEIAADATIEPGTSLRGATRIGADSIIGPHSTLIDTTVGEQSRVIHSYVDRRRRSATWPPSARSPTCGPAPRSRQGSKAGSLRRDQGLARRRGGQGPAPRLRRRR